MSDNKTTHKKIESHVTRPSRAPATPPQGQMASKPAKRRTEATDRKPESGAEKRSAGPTTAARQPVAEAKDVKPQSSQVHTEVKKPASVTKTTPDNPLPKPKVSVQAAPSEAKPMPAAKPVTSTPSVAPAKPAATEKKMLTLPATITVRDLAGLLSTSPINIIRELMKNGVMVNINQDLDFDTAAIVAADVGFEVKEERPPEPIVEEPVEPVRKRHEYTEDEKAKLKPRPPVVTIMGHVDHGKTSLLDVIRQTNVVASEVGGITQHIGAYQVVKQDKKITFLDTPGHEAFTAMRARGAMATDIAILVVAADDGVQPQTLEAISHARAAQVPIIVALNKIDKPTANPDGVKRQLADAGLVVEDYGGDVICVPVSAKQKTGLETLLEMILLVAEMANLKANPDAPATGTVIEGRLDKTRGPLATLLVQDGTLHLGDYLVIGDISGRIRAMFDDKGQHMDVAEPASPAVVLGLTDVPVAGETFRVTAGEHEARAEASAEAQRRQEASVQQKQKVLSLDEFFAQAQAGQMKELDLILKADVQGSIEPIVQSVEKLGEEGIHAKFLHTGTGNISESDIMLAMASNAIVLGFSVHADAAATRLAEAEGVDIRLYDIIYRLVDDVDKALKGLLEPKFEDVVIGHAEIRKIWSMAHKKAAGCGVTDGIAARNATVRLKRAGQILFEGSIASLRRFKDDVREVTVGMECGLMLEGFEDYKEGDTLEFYRKEQVA